MKIIADTHTHTVASTHAYSTLLENVEYAKKKGLRAICTTDHAPAMPDSSFEWKFYSAKETIPEYINGIWVLAGVEANVVDYSGALDLPAWCLKKLDWVIASFHQPVLVPATTSEHTAAYEAVVKNPFVDCLGHSGSPAFNFDIKKIVKLCKEYDKVVELNANTYVVRKSSIANCKEIAKACKKYDVSVVLASDSHIATTIGEFKKPKKLCEEVGISNKLIINSDFDRFRDYIMRSRERKDAVEASK